MFRNFLTAAACLALGACSDSCSNEVVTRIISPDGQREAVMFQRDCGATTGFSTQISVLESGDPLSGGGNTFRADDDHGAARIGAWGGSWAEMNWLSTDQLLIRYAANSRLFEQDTDVSGVEIIYEVVGD
ncbi:MAG: hypothetical protein GW800_05015 [Sphingomonadales bacterium]|nr:hypothetical protein [Sphingomonadales bacterium]